MRFTLRVKPHFNHRPFIASVVAALPTSHEAFTLRRMDDRIGSLRPWRDDALRDLPFFIHYSRSLSVSLLASGAWGEELWRGG